MGAAAYRTAIPTSSNVGGVDATHTVTSACLKSTTRASPDDCVRFQRCNTQGHRGQYRNVSHRDRRWLLAPEISTRRWPRMTMGLRMSVAPPRRMMAWVIEPNLERDDEGGDDLSFLCSSLIRDVIGIAVLLLMQCCNLQADCCAAISVCLLLLLFLCSSLSVDWVTSTLSLCQSTLGTAACSLGANVLIKSKFVLNITKSFLCWHSFPMRVHFHLITLSLVV